MYISELKMKLLGQTIQKYENSSQVQRSRSNVTTCQTPLAFTMGHILTEPSYINFCSEVSEILCGQTHRRTEKRCQKQYLQAVSSKTETKTKVLYIDTKSNR